MTIKLVSYNVLADSYIRPAWYPHTPDEWLTPELRHPALVEEIVRMNADVVALQEVERPVFSLLEQKLGTLGYESRYEPKGRNKPDGCAMFVRSSACAVESWQRLDYADSADDNPASGHLAQLATLNWDGRTLAVANTHLKWAPPDTARDEHLGARQLDELADHCSAAQQDGWVVCGDYNCTPGSAVLKKLHDAGFVDAHDGSDAPTCNANRETRKLDHIFIAGSLVATPILIGAIQADTALPSAEYPSDHLSVGVHLSWGVETS